jgi:hypothetical protein
MAETTGQLGGLKDQEYTGENRCLPCTAVNTLLAGMFAWVVGLAVFAVTSAQVAMTTGLLVFAASVVVIYLKGYFVPGTPTLTKRYFPVWLLRLFGKEPLAEWQGERIPEDEQLDAEAALLQIGALEECEDSDDLCLADSFREVWHEEIQNAKEDSTEREAMLELLDVSDRDVEFRDFGDNEAFEVGVDGERIGRWESKAAFHADIGAARVLEDAVENWESFSVQQKSQLLTGLRLFMTTCPNCGGIPELGTEMVESCCTAHQVAAVDCNDCGARLFEHIQRNRESMRRA